MQPSDRAYELANGFRAAQLVRAAAEFNIPDLLADGAMTAGHLSNPTGIDAGRLQRLLRGLAALGVLEENADGSFANTEVGKLFRKDVPGSWRPLAMYLMPESYRTWEHLVETLRSGAIAQQLAYGIGFWEYVERNPDYASRFNQAMAANAERVVRLVAGCIEASGAPLIVDVGGGQGGLVGGVLLSIPSAHGIVCDVAAGLAETREYLARLGVADRCTIEESDFFESVPGGGDVYLLKDIIHDWPDEQASQILDVCRRAMRTGARLLIVERLVPSPVTTDPADLNAVMTDLQMMMHFGSRERTLDAMRALVEPAGFEFRGLVPGGVYKVFEAVAR